MISWVIRSEHIKEIKTLLITEFKKKEIEFKKKEILVFSGIKDIIIKINKALVLGYYIYECKGFTKKLIKSEPNFKIHVFKEDCWVIEIQHNIIMQKVENKIYNYIQIYIKQNEIEHTFLERTIYMKNIKYKKMSIFLESLNLFMRRKIGIYVDNKKIDRLNEKISEECIIIKQTYIKPLIINIILTKNILKIIIKSFDLKKLIIVGKYFKMKNIEHEVFREIKENEGYKILDKLPKTIFNQSINILENSIYTHCGDFLKSSEESEFKQITGIEIRVKKPFEMEEFKSYLNDYLKNEFKIIKEG